MVHLFEIPHCCSKFTIPPPKKNLLLTKCSEGGATVNNESFRCRENFVAETAESNQVRQSQGLEGFLKLQKPNQIKPKQKSKPMAKISSLLLKVWHSTKTCVWLDQYIYIFIFEEEGNIWCSKSTLIISYQIWGSWVAQCFRPLPSAQVMISLSWDGAPHRALCSAGSLHPPPPLSFPLPTCDLSNG